MSAAPRTEDRWADAVARPSRQGDWRYVAEEMARLCREMEREIEDLENGVVFERLQDRIDCLNIRIETLERELEETKGRHV